MLSPIVFPVRIRGCATAIGMQGRHRHADRLYQIVPGWAGTTILESVSLLLPGLLHQCRGRRRKGRRQERKEHRSDEVHVGMSAAGDQPHTQQTVT